MSLTGLFLCLFLAGHLAGNLQLFIGGWEGTVMFNNYAEFMSSHPAIQTIAWGTKILIVLHVVLALFLVIRNRRARDVRYKYNRPDKNSGFASRTMGWMGTLLLVFVVVHLINFWAPMHYDHNFPIQMNDEGNFYTADGIEHADSISISAHKWFFQPKEAGMILFRETKKADSALSFGGPYIADGIVHADSHLK